MQPQVVNDPVRAFLEQQGYACYIVEGGLDYLLTSWESTVASIVDGEVMDYNAYLKCMDRRRILEETLALIPSEEQAYYLKQVEEADEELKRHLIGTSMPLCGQVVAIEQGYSPQRQWWYYYRPRVVDNSWPEMF
jgi:hypothetical protein